MINIPRFAEKQAANQRNSAFKMQLWAIADIHLSFKSNREEWAKLQHKKDDGLILAGDGMWLCDVGIR